MPSQRGNEHSLIVYDSNGKVLKSINRILQPEVDGNTVRHLRGQIRGIKHNFAVVDDAHLGQKINKGDAVKPEWVANDAKASRPTKANQEESRFKALESRFRMMEERLAKLEPKTPNSPPQQ